ncbi:hypothetical protein [Gynuella sp.]|uniref:hypothetical protein n=1 Tax=Gynuella sp. TaxID=2969146 RepID=UPI003D0DC816
MSIVELITGPRHGALLNVSNKQCGNSGYVCIDLEGEYGSAEVGRATYSMALSSKVAGNSVNVSVDLDFKPNLCHGYPVLEDIRTR